MKLTSSLFGNEPMSSMEVTDSRMLDPSDLEVAYARLKNWFADCSGAIVAFSGGVDSSLVAFLGRRFLGKSDVLAVISASPSLKLSDLDAGKAFCANNDLSLRVIRTEELLNSDYSSNPSNRCYFCKSTLYEKLDPLLREFPQSWILNGTNLDDLGDYRPGLEAASEHQVRSPLAECGIGKEMVRALSRSFELECWDKPASPCLSSRIPYGQQVTEEKLRRIEGAEAWLVKLGFPVCRVRHVEDAACVEVPQERIGELPSLNTIQAEMRRLGFVEAFVDPEGFVTGKLNRAINE